MTEAQSEQDWASYLMPGTSHTLRNLAGITDVLELASFERTVSQQAEMDLRRNPMHDPTFDLSHLQAIHRRLFEDVYPFAGELRYVDMQKPGQTGDPFVHHGFAETYAAVVADQLHQEDDLAHLSDPGRWADRAAYFVAQMLHTHPFREGNGRAIRLWTTELAAAAGHELDWTRVDAPRNDAAARAAGGGDLEPMRYLLGHVAGATIGVDRPINALDALDDGLRAAAWKRTGLVHGDPADREWLLERIGHLDVGVALVRDRLSQLPAHPPTTEQPATIRWAGFARCVDQRLVDDVEDWPKLAAEFDKAAADGENVADTFPALAIRLPDAGPVDFTEQAPTPRSEPSEPTRPSAAPGPAPTPRRGPAR